MIRSHTASLDRERSREARELERLPGKPPAARPRTRQDDGSRRCELIDDDGQPMPWIREAWVPHALMIRSHTASLDRERSREARELERRDHGRPSTLAGKTACRAPTDEARRRIPQM
jgi:hypothetical protein